MDSVGAALIARNVEATITECIESFINHVDQCVVIKAGVSTDKTSELLDALKEKYPDKMILDNFEWIDDFSAARNYSFSKLNTDWGFWTDGDDVIVGAENLKLLANEMPEDTGGLWFPYHYCTDEFGNIVVKYQRERLLRMKNAWVWRSRIHETVSPLIPCKFASTDRVINVHKHNSQSDRGDRNFKILNIMYQEDPEEKRVWLYLGHQHFAAQNWMTSAGWYLKFGSDNGALPLERYQALSYASKALRNMKDSQAIRVALQAIELYPQFKDAYIDLAYSYYLVENQFDKAIHFAKLADTKELIQEPPSVIFINPMHYTFDRYALLADCYLRKNDFEEALKWAIKAHSLRPTPESENYVERIKTQIMRNRVDIAIKTLAVGLTDNQEYNKLALIPAITPSWYREMPAYDQLKDGVEHYTKGIKDASVITGNDGRCVVNVANVKDTKQLLVDLDKKYETITVVSPKPNPELKISTVLSQRDMEDIIVSEGERHIINLRNEPTRVWCEYDHKKLDGLFIRMFLGQPLEYWSPDTIRAMGCGGSETAAARVAESFARGGHKPIIYSADNQVWDGVIYRPHDHFSLTDCDWFISSRIPDVFNIPIHARQKWLWVHDVHCFDRLTPDIASQLNVIVGLSHWHVDHLKRTYPFLQDAEVIDMDDQDKTFEDLWTPNVFYKEDICNKLPKMAIIGNGIDTERFKDLDLTKKPNSFLWCSSPDRGLEEVLRYWKDIKRELPDATLRIFYGWNYFDTSLHIPAQREFKERIRVLLKQDGVEWCNRIGQVELAHEMAKAECMLYPPPHNFRETYGIAFLEAQAAGMIVFYRQNGALGETVGNRGIPLALNLTPEQIVETVVNGLKNKNGKMLDKGRKYAMKRSWEKQADKFLKLFKELDNGKHI